MHPSTKLLLQNFEINSGFEGKGVYMVCVLNCHTKTEHVLYIGSSNDVHQRTHSHKHPFMIVLNRLSDYYTPVYLRCFKTDHYFNLERYLIQELRPKLNTQWR
jgi:hypothetical protein